MTNNNSLWRQIGGRRAISLKGSLLFLPIIILSVPLQSSEKTDFNKFLLWTMASAMGVIPAALILYIAHKTLFKNRSINPVSGSYVVMLGGIVGAAKGFTTGYFAVNFGLIIENVTNETILRTLNSTIIGCVFLPLGSLIYSSIDQYIDLRNQILKQRSVITRNSFEFEAINTQLREQMNNKVNDNVNKLLEKTRSELSEVVENQSVETEWSKLAALLRETARDAIRPLSHTMWESDLRDLYEPNFLEVLLYSIRNIDFSPLIVCSLFLITSLRNILNTYGIFDGTIFILAQMCFLYLILRIAKEIYGRGEKTANRFLSILSIVCILHFFFIFFFTKAFSNNIYPGPIFISILWLVTLILSIGFLRSIIQRKNLDLLKIADILDEKYYESLSIKQETLRVSREIAKYLHTNVQSRIMASALAIEQAGKSGNKDKMLIEIKSAQEMLIIPSAEYFNVIHEPMSLSVNKVISNWIDLLEIELVNNLEDNAVSMKALRDLIDVLNEAITNAFRHGRAEKLKIILTHLENKNVYVNVMDDGVGNLSGKPGLGFETFDRIAGTAWSLTNNKVGNGTNLEITIPNVLLF